jgi:hypothetical protein
MRISNVSDSKNGFTHSFAYAGQENGVLGHSRVTVNQVSLVRNREFCLRQEREDMYTSQCPPSAAFNRSQP